MKPLVIYHGGGCTDGFGAAFAAWLKLGDSAEYLPMEYGRISTLADFDMKVSLAAKGNEVYILDFSFPRITMDALFRHAKRVVWLDHHKTAFEMWCPGEYERYCREDDASTNGFILLDNNKSGAMLAWEYFHPGTEVPMLIQHIDDRDRWVFALPGSKEIHAALASYKPWSFQQWRVFAYSVVDGNALIGEAYDPKNSWWFDEGAAILRAHNQHIQAALKQARPSGIKVLLSEDGFAPVLNGLAANAPSFLASDLGHELANKSGTFGLVWSMAGDGQVHCSLRSNGDYDVSAIAKVFGGGGHRNAAGFSTDINTLLSWLK